jgi:murein DD-endopeptidase MepM/ murein hydrolase activator NlpD
MKSLVAQPRFELSRNIYRIPYASGTTIKITNDHNTHDPLGRYDMIGIEGGASCSINYKIVAAAAGVIRRLDDSHDLHGSDCDDDNCDSYEAFNNYIWIEHANGEWSKYSHIMRNSASQVAGLHVGDTVCAGTFLGYECDIGKATGPHLHFEVRHPNDPDNIDISVEGGFMRDAQHRIPVINSNLSHYFLNNEVYIASGTAYCLPSVQVPGMLVLAGAIRIDMASTEVTTKDPVAYRNGSNGLFQAGESVIIKPGFVAEAGSYFIAKIRSCGTTPFPGGCN